jgi:hypothetical protein
VDRAYSNYLYYVRDLREPRSFEEAVVNELNVDIKKIPPNKHYVYMGYYYNQVQQYLNNFSQVKVCLFEDMKKEPVLFMRNIYKFLEVDDSFKPDTSKKFNVSGIPKNKILHRLFFQPTKFKLFIKDMLIKTFFTEDQLVTIIEKLRSKNLNQKQPLADKTRNYLIQLYKPEIEKLQKLLQRDLSGWI